MTDYYGFQTIATSLDDGILRVTLNRPDRLNALDKPMHKELRALYEQIAHDADVRVVVITGAGRAFCVGADFQQMQDNLAAGGYPDGRPDMLGDGADIARGILRVRQPMIAMVNGHALGIGATLALFCDVVFMSSAARIGDPHVQAGLVAGDGGCVLWPMLLGINRAKEYLMTGDLLSAADADRLGLVNHVVELKTRIPKELGERDRHVASREKPKFLRLLTPPGRNRRADVGCAGRVGTASGGGRSLLRGRRRCDCRGRSE